MGILGYAHEQTGDSHWHIPYEICAQASRVWRGTTCAAVLKGHRGRGVWRTAALPHQQLATAGADGSIKIWSLADILPTLCLEGPAASGVKDGAQEGESRAPCPQVESFTLQHSTAPLTSAVPGKFGACR